MGLTTEGHISFDVAAALIVITVELKRNVYLALWMYFSIVPHCLDP